VELFINFCFVLVMLRVHCRDCIFVTYVIYTFLLYYCFCLYKFNNNKIKNFLLMLLGQALFIGNSGSAFHSAPFWQPTRIKESIQPSLPQKLLVNENENYLCLWLLIWRIFFIRKPKKAVGFIWEYLLRFLLIVVSLKTMLQTRHP